MKTKLSLILSFCITSLFAQVGIGTINPHPSSVLDVKSNNKGLLIPRLSTQERDLIQNPAEGLTIYNKTIKCIEVNISTNETHDWKNMCNGSTPNPIDFLIDCSNFNSNGTFAENVAFNGNTVSYVIKNNSTSNVTQDFSDAVSISTNLGNITVNGNANNSVSFNPGESKTLTYSLSGTPNNDGVLTVSFNKINMVCSNTINVISSGNFPTLAPICPAGETRTFVLDYTDNTTSNTSTGNQGAYQNLKITLNCSNRTVTHDVNWLNGLGITGSDNSHYFLNFDDNNSTRNITDFRTFISITDYKDCSTGPTNCSYQKTYNITEKAVSINGVSFEKELSIFRSSNGQVKHSCRNRDLTQPVTTATAPDVCTFTIY